MSKIYQIKMQRMSNERLSGELRKLKSMFILEKVVNRKAYAKFSPSRPRIASFVASVNSTEFLTDD